MLRYRISPTYMNPNQIMIYDTTLRDGTQAEGISFSVHDKIRIAEKLDAFGIHYIEGGWPGSNPKDIAFFDAGQKEKVAPRKDLRLWQHLPGERRARSGPSDRASSGRRNSDGNDRRQKLEIACRADTGRNNRRKPADDSGIGCVSEVEGTRGHVRRRAFL